MTEKRTYNTKQRDEILRSIASFGSQHFTAADVTSRLKQEGNTVGQATVYRLLERLAQGGTLRKYVVDGTTAACYQNYEDAVRED